MCTLSLLSPTISDAPTERGSEVHAMAINNLPVTAKLITKKTAKDTVLTRLVICIHYDSTNPSTTLSDSLRLELTIQDGCIICGKHVVISKVLRAKLDI